MDLRLRRAALADLDQVMGLETAGFPPGIVEDREVFSRRIGAFPEGFLLAESPGQVPVGYFCAEIWDGWDLTDLRRFDLGHDIGAWLSVSGSTLYIASMTVAPWARGGGLGRFLFRQSLWIMGDKFPALTQAVLIVSEHWTGARKIYEGEGFSEAGRLAAFFQPAEGPPGDAILMVRQLKPI